MYKRQMLSYAFQVLNEQGYKNIATEQFHNTAELMAAILEKGIAIQLKDVYKRQPFFMGRPRLVLFRSGRGFLKPFE